MIVCGYEQHSLDDQLQVAIRLGASCVELYPRWRTAPDGGAVGRQIRDAGLEVWSAHGPWGNETWSEGRVDLAATIESQRQRAVADVQRAIDWLADAGGRCLVLHPGVLSDASEFQIRSDALSHSLSDLVAPAAARSVVLCVENLPRGSFPGSYTRDNAAIVRSLRSQHVALCVDTGHANIMADVASEIRCAADLLHTTHVHDNDGQRDNHLLPGLGTIHWPDFSDALAAVDYRGVVMLECPRYLRENPGVVSDELRGRLSEICQRPVR
jgi:sugar phosphate isomerase/epimerase